MARVRGEEGADRVSVLQAWLVAGIPSLAISLLLFVGRSPVRALLGYAVLAAGFAFMVSVDRASAAVFGGLLALLYATGRGGSMELDRAHPDERPEVATDEGHGHVGTE